MPGDSSDAGSKGNSDSGIHTDPTPSPPLADDEPECVYQQNIEYISQPSVSSQEEPLEELSTAEDDVTPNLCATAPEFSSQECTLSCSSSPSFTKNFTINDNDTPTHNILPMQETVVVCQDEDRVGSSYSLMQKTDVLCTTEDRVGGSCPLTQNADVFCTTEDQVGDCCPLMQKTDVLCTTEDRVGSSCPLMQDTDVLCTTEDRVGNSCPLVQHTLVACLDKDQVDDTFLLTQETSVLSSTEDRVGNSCPLVLDTVVVCPNEYIVGDTLLLKQETDVLCTNENRVGNSFPLALDTVAICPDEDQVTNSFLLAKETVDVLQDKDQVFGSCLLSQETVVCPDLVKASLSQESSYQSPSITVSPKIPDSLLLDNSSDDLKIMHEEYEILSESIKENTKEVLTENSDEGLSDIADLVTQTSLNESKIAQCMSATEVVEMVSSVNLKNEEYEVCPIKNEIRERVLEPEFTATIVNSIEASRGPDTDSRFPVIDDDVVPIPPPRRRRSLCRAADKLATKIVEEAIREGVEEAAHSRLSSPLSITEAVTRWLNSHESSPLTCRFPDSDSEDEEDEEGIEAVEEMESTGPKNGQGNPFLVPSHNGIGIRVAKDCDSVTSEWNFERARDMCDPTRSVDKYYRLGADGGEGDRMSPSVYKTAVHIHHNGPFPCGVCCIIQ